MNGDAFYMGVAILIVLAVVAGILLCTENSREIDAQLGHGRLADSELAARQVIAEAEDITRQAAP